MPGPGCTSTRAHTPIVSKRQQGLFGSELARRRKGQKGKMSSITTEELEGHLHESAGKKLPGTALMRGPTAKSHRRKG